MGLGEGHYGRHGCLGLLKRQQWGDHNQGSTADMATPAFEAHVRVLLTQIL